eukprot:Colp12_sorted_trinity150504_noHs@27613
MAGRLLTLRLLPTQSACKAITQHLWHFARPVTQAPPLHTAIASVVAARPIATFGKRPSLAARAAEFPEVVRQWHPHKNTVGPESVTPFLAKKFWFLCDEGHEWDAMLLNRTRNGTGCPTCKHRRAHAGNTLRAKYPAVAA